MTEKKEKKKKGFFDRMFEFQTKPLRIMAREVTKGIKEGTKEERVIVKIRCPSCHKLYDETLDSCPHCGAE